MEQFVQGAPMGAVCEMPSIAWNSLLFSHEQVDFILDFSLENTRMHSQNFRRLQHLLVCYSEESSVEWTGRVISV